MLSQRLIMTECDAQYKKKKALTIPLIKEAITILNNQKEVDRIWVFPNPKKKGYLMNNVVNTSFKKARTKLALITKIKN